MTQPSDESLRDRLAELRSGTHAVIHLDRYASNIKQIQAIAGADQSVMAVVKANAYGHGAPECARVAVDTGCVYLGVARIDEALQLRQSGIDAPILVIGPPNIAQIPIAIQHDISLTVATEASTDAVIDHSMAVNKSCKVHLKLDAGLHRYGALPEVAMKLARHLSTANSVHFEGIYTHFSSADENEIEPTANQVTRFRATVERIQTEIGDVRYIHMANSAATLAGLHSGTNMIRAGIATYGLDPSDEAPVPAKYQQILELRSVLTRRSTLAAGECVSYNRTYCAAQDEEIGAIPIGYADGIERHLSNQGWFIHREGRCPIVGRVCMDQTVVRVPGSAREGDVLTIIGDGRDGSMTVATIGELSSTNTYEPVTRMAARIPRIFCRSGVPVSWSVPLLGESGSF